MELGRVPSLGFSSDSTIFRVDQSLLMARIFQRCYDSMLFRVGLVILMARIFQSFYLKA